ncbi:MAG TPA: hypothetical protein VLG38_05990 [Gammaproteobacteria bacterium]|nr:hypothetical protein [Gammaproteobacteria bacterium]
MLEIEYTASPAETAQATLDFMSNRPVVAILFGFMRVACILLLVGFCITLLNKATRVQDVVSVFFALLWLMYYKKINRWVIQRSLKLRQTADLKCMYKIDEKSILYRIHNSAPHHIEWKKLKYVLKNKSGYIIPLTGVSNAGKFLWLPQRSLSNNDAESKLLSLITKFKLKIKEL